VPDSLPLQVDYTSRDYRSLREDMIARIKARVPEWSAEDPSDFGVALVEAFAYMGDIMSYYIDRAANESSLTTATRRASVVALARDLGYEASGYQSATATVTVVNEANRAILLPKRTVLSATVNVDDATVTIPFETDEEITIASEASATVTCTQGFTRSGPDGYGESLGLSSGLPNQIFEIPDVKILRDSIQVYVFDGVNYAPWRRVDHIVDYSPLSRVYTVREADIDTVYLQFGDGTSGIIPTSGHAIFVEYQLSDGARGNVPAGAIKNIDAVPLLSASEIAVLNGFISVINDGPATGGANPEDLASIRFNASQAFRSAGRAVSLDDFQNVALSNPRVGKASAVSSTPASVLLAVAPYRTELSAEERPGFEFDDLTSTFVVTDELTELKDSVLETVSAAALAGTTVTMLDPVYVPIELTIEIVGIASLRQADARRVVRGAIEERLDYARVPFGAVIAASDIVALVTSLGVTRDTSISVFRRVGDEDSVSLITAAPDEIVILRSEDFVITVTGGLEEEV
jgi:hypothetical protein